MRKIKIPLVLREEGIIDFIFISALILFFFSDAANKYLVYRGADFTRISIIVRAVYELIFFLLIMLFINKSRLQFLIFFGALFLIFATGQLMVANHSEGKYNFMENINIFNKYLFVLIIYFAIYKYQYYQANFKRLIKVLDIIFIANSILIIIGFVFRIRMFSTYILYNAFTYKFGYSGLIPVQNEATLFLFLGLSFYYYRYLILSRVEDKWKFICVFVSAFLLGTKGIYIFLFLLFVYHFFKKTSIRQKKIAGYVALFLALAIFIFFQTGYSRILFGYYLREFNEFGLWHTLLSGRNTFFGYKLLEILSSWNPLNFFIGGQDQSKYLMEMDLVDAFLFFGLIGTCLMFVFYFKTLFRFTLKNSFFSFFVFSFFLIAFFAGHFFASAVNALYLCVVSLFFYISHKQKEIKQVE